MKPLQRINGLSTYIWLAIYLIALVVVPLLRTDGGVTPDTIQYVKLAYQLPNPATNLFPIGYPLLIRMFFELTHDYYFSTKILTFLSSLAIIFFSYRKRFFFSETMILLTFKMCLGLFMYSISETVVVPLLYLLIYFFYSYFTENISKRSFVLWASAIITAMFVVRYATVYLFIGIGSFYLLQNIKTILKKSFYIDGYFYFLALSACGFLGYLLFNMVYFGSLFGSEIRSTPLIYDFKFFAVANILGMLSVVNPIFSLRIIKDHLSFNILQIAITTIDLSFLIVFCSYYFTRFKNHITIFHRWLLFVGVFYMLFIFLSEFWASIEPINSRMIAYSSFMLIFSFIILFLKTNNNNWRIINLIAIVSIIYNIGYAAKNPVNYLAYKQKVTEAVNSKPHAQYYFNDDTVIHFTAYHIPLVNLDFKYAHTDAQPAYIYSKVVPIVKPELIELTKDTLSNKQLVIYNSDIK